MSVSLGSAHGKIIIDGSGAKAGVNQATGALSTLGQKAAGVGTIIKGMLGAAVVQGAFIALKNGIVGSVGAASDLNETATKTTEVFGTATQQIQQFAANAQTALGQSRQQALDAAGTFGIFGKSAGLSGAALGDFSTDLVTLASDFASFYNTSPEEAITAIGAALRGESEPIRKYGVLLDDATLRQKAFEMGLIRSTKEALTPQNKVLAANAAIMDQAQVAMGDFARTSDGAANRERIMAAQTANLSASFGSILLPVWQMVLSFLTGSFLPAAQRFLDDFILPAVPAVQSFIQMLSGGGSLSEAFRMAGMQLYEAFPGAGQFLYDVGTAINDVKTEGQNLWNLLAEGDFTGLFGLEEDSPIIGGLLTARETVLKVAGAVVDNWPRVVQLFDQGVDTFNQVAGVISASWPQIVTTVQGGIATVRGHVEGFLEDAKNLWNANKNTIIAVVLTLWEIIKGAFNSAIGVIGPAVQTLVASVKTGFASFGPTIEAFKRLWETLKPVLGAVLAAIGVIILTLIALIVGVFNGIAMALAPFLTMIAGVVAGVVTIIQGVINVISGVVQLLVGIFTGNSQLIQAAWAQMGQGISQIVSGLVATVSALFTGLWETLKALFTGLVQGVIAFFTGLYDQLVGHSIIPDMVKGILEWLQSLVTDGIAFVGEFISGMVTAVQDGAERLIEAGKLMIEGFKQGIQDKFVEVLSKVKELFSKIPGVVEAVLDIESPSKLLRKLGRFTMGGFGLGAEDEAQSVYDVFERMASSLAQIVAPGPIPQPAGAGGGPSVHEGDVNNEFKNYFNSGADEEAWKRGTLKDIQWRQRRY